MISHRLTDLDRECIAHNEATAPYTAAEQADQNRRTRESYSLDTTDAGDLRIDAALRRAIGRSAAAGSLPVDLHRVYRRLAAAGPLLWHSVRRRAYVFEAAGQAIVSERCGTATIRAGALIGMIAQVTAILGK